jgi:hypothetical protein
MIAAILFLAAATVGIDCGWQPLPDGGMKYIIQLEPDDLDLLRSGQKLESDIPASVKDVRGYQILVGKEKLIRLMPPSVSITETQKPALGPAFSDAAGKLPGSTAQGKESLDQGAAREAGARNIPAATVEPPLHSPDPPTAAPNKPWLPLTLISLLSFSLLAALIYLSWIHLELRARYRKLLETSLPPAAMPLRA